MNVREIYQHKYFKFGFYGLLYVLWVIWLGNYWWLPGILVIFDMYITQKVNWSPWKKKEGKNSTFIEWLDALIFAVIAVTVINIFLFQNYKIPTGSMEKSLLIGDHLYVSKVAFGPRLPNTPIAFPFAQHTMPGTQKTKSYVEWIKRPYKRLKGTGQIHRDNIVVFNFPEGDTVIVQNQAESYYSQMRRLAQQFKENDLAIRQSAQPDEIYKNQARDYIWKNFDIVVRPVDKKDNYIKRCVGTPGDTLQIIERQLFVNGKPQVKRDEVQYKYRVNTNKAFSNKALKRIGIASNDIKARMGFDYLILLNANTLKEIKKFNNVVNITPVEEPAGEFDFTVFPHSSAFPWNGDNFGPLWVPKKGVTVDLNITNLCKYERIIEMFEDNDLEVKDGIIYINGEIATSYTFKMNYYWMMGDNRHDSADSRYWGFVPEDHVIGKPKFIWLSLDADYSFPRNIRLRRMFMGIK